MIGYIHSIETLGLVDGPGIRVVVFMQGCPLRCLFCHNPDTFEVNIGKKMTAEEVFKYILRYKSYFGDKGGVTFSGGEPLLQQDFLIEVLRLCKKENIHTCLDTAGSVICREEVLEYTDLVLMDVKAISEEKYLKMTGQNIANSLKFWDLCAELNKELWVRQVIIPSINDNEEYMEDLADFLKKYSNVTKVELLPYHDKAIFKYEQLGLPYKLKDVPNMDEEKCQELNDYLNELLNLK